MGHSGKTNIEKLKATRDVKTLIKILQNAKYKKDDKVRIGAIEALGEIGDATAVEPLIQALNDEESIPAEAAGALGKLGDIRAVEPLIQLLKNEYAGIRGAAAEALGEIDDARALKPLHKALKKEIGIRKKYIRSVKKEERGWDFEAKDRIFEYVIEKMQEAIERIKLKD